MLPAIFALFICSVFALSPQAERSPSVISLTPEKTLSVGDEYTLICVVDALPAPTVTIKHVDKTGRETVVAEQVSSEMVTVTVHQIEELTLGDGGEYVCSASNPLGDTEATTSLFVGAPPEFETKPQSVVTSEPQRVNFLCVARGTPTPKISWYFNGEKIDDVSPPGYLLSFLLTKDTAGYYSCVANNTFGTVTSEAKASIQDPVIIGVEDDSLYEQPANSSCSPVDPVSLFLDVAVSGSSVLLVGLDNELYRASDINAVPVHVHDSCCVKKIALVGEEVYGITPTNWLVSWNKLSNSWEVHMFGERVENIESYQGSLYISTDGVNYKRCDMDTESCTDDDVITRDVINKSRDLKVNKQNKLMRYNNLKQKWEQVSGTSDSTEMRSLATASSGKIYAVGDDGHLYVRTSLANTWSRTLQPHTGFSAVEVDCQGTIWVLKNGALYSVLSDNSLSRHSSLLKLRDFAVYKGGFVGISQGGDVVISPSVSNLAWTTLERAGSLISIDSYQHDGLLGVYPEGLKVKANLDANWVEYSSDCGLKDATELVSASYCNVTVPLVTLDAVTDPEVDSEGNPVEDPEDPYTPISDSLCKINTDLLLICHVAYTGNEPNVYMTFNGVIIPTNLVKKDDSTVTVTYYISDLSFEQSGEYRCHADNDDVVGEDTVDVDVYDTFTITTQPSSQATYVSGNVVLEINANSATNLVFTWTKVKKDGSEEEFVEEDKTHSSVRTNGDLHIYDVQSYHEASYYCTVSNGKDTITSDVVNVTIIEPQYLATLQDGKVYVSPDSYTFYPIYITTGVLDIAVYKQVLYLVLADYQVYTYPITGRQEHLTLLPDSCCVSSIAVYSDFGSVNLLATDISTFDLLVRRINGVTWENKPDSLTGVSVVSDEIVATQRTSGYSLFKTGIDSLWKPTNTRIPMLHIVGHHDSKIIGVGHDRRLYTAAEYTDSWTRIPGFNEVECATIDNDGGVIYIVYTSGEIKRHKIAELERRKKKTGTIGSTIFSPEFKVLHVSWEGTIYYGDSNNRLLTSRAFTSYPLLHPNIAFAYAVVTLPDTWKTVLVLNKRGIHNVTETGSTLLRPLEDMSSMTLHEDRIILSHRDDPVVYGLNIRNIRHGKLVEITRFYVIRMFSTPEFMGLIPSRDDDTTDDGTDSTDMDSTDSTDDDKEDEVMVRRNGTEWQLVEGTGVQYMAFLTVLRINSRTSTILSPAVTYYVELGDNIEMLCLARGTPTNNQVITPRSDEVEDIYYRGYYRSEDVALMEVSTVTSIIRIQAEENMVEWYRCTASNMYGTDYQDFRVVIWREMIFVETPEDTVIEEGTHHVLLCAAEALPEPTITWYKDGVKVTVTDSVIPLKTGGLLLAPASIYDSGSYTCVANNSREEISASADVFVKQPVEFVTVPEDTEVKEGEDVTLSCSATGHPKPVISWTRDNGQEIPESADVREDGSLVLRNAVSSQSGQYTCTATNSYQTETVSADLQINEPEVPVITIGPEDETVFIGTQISITCVASGDPRPQVYILKNQIPQDIRVTMDGGMSGSDHGDT